MGVESTGDPTGYPVLWCHGGLSSRLDVLPLKEAAKALGVALVSIDRPGIGTSARRRDVTVADWPQVALREMSRLGHERFAVAGWSAGGPYALACAVAAPDRVEKVVTIASMHPITDDRYRRELGMRLDRELFRLAADHPTLAKTLVRVGSHMPAWMIMNDVMKASVESERQHLRARSALIVDFIREATRCGCEGVVHDYARLGTEWGFDLEAVSCPVTVWHGVDDPLVPVDHGRDLASLIPTANFRPLADRGHFLPFTDAVAILTDLREFG